MLAGAAAIGAPIGVQAQNLPAPAVPIQDLYDTLLVIMKSGRTTPFTQRFQTLAPVVERALDLPLILQVAVGLGWAGLRPAQQSQLLAAFRNYTVATYVANFDTYSGEQLDVSPTLRALGNGDQVVHTTVAPVSGTSHSIDYVMRQESRGWQGADVLLDGSISRVAVLRSDFRHLLASGASELAADLERKAADLMGGANPV